LQDLYEKGFVIVRLDKNSRPVEGYCSKPILIRKSQSRAIKIDQEMI
jgi:hypothetical protein